MIVRKVPVKQCPSCLQEQLQAIEIEAGQVASYVCYSCGAYYDAEISHDHEQNEDWWIGKLRNPDFWLHDMTAALGGLVKVEKRIGRGIAKYIGSFPIERIDSEAA